MSETVDYYKISEKGKLEYLNNNEIVEKLILNNEEKTNLKIAYILKWVVVNGGTKVIFEHSNNLSKRGHKIYLVCHDSAPTWYNLDENIEYIQVPENEILCKYIPQDVDLIVCASNIYISEAIEQKIAPVIYFEQGSHHLFNRGEVEPEKLDFIAKQFSVCNNIYTVSEYAKKKILEIYNKDSFIVPNAVNKKVFYSSPEEKQKEKLVISTIGPEDWEFKGLKYVLDAIKELEKTYDFDFYWISPRPTETQLGNIIINPEQSVIGDVLRKTDIFISASAFESFGLPVLEAMTSGAAVVCTDAGGNMEFSVDGETCLIVNKRDSEDIVNKVKMLIENEALREKLSKEALKMAEKYDYNKNCDKLEEYFKSIAKYSVEK